MSQAAGSPIEQAITWHETGDAEFPYEARAETTHLRVRVNDFPDEPLYTLLVDGVASVHFDDWPARWRKTRKDDRPADCYDPGFEALKAEVEAYSRLCGYYILGLVSIRHLRAAGAAQETILEQLVERFDDDTRDPNPDDLPDHGWVDYEVDQARARAHAVESLVGGRQIGHLRDAMLEATAGGFFDRLVALCGRNPRFYVGLGLGDSRHTYLYGVLVVADDLAGIVWIVESD